jgi:hypothetical protein
VPRPTSFRLRLLQATPSVEAADGSPVELPAGKPLAVLAYLHLASEPVSREALAGLLWPGSTRERARGSVRHALWTLRQRLGEELFATDEPVALAPEMVESDLAELKKLLSEGDARGALERWHGPPFGEFVVSDAPPWERWAEGVREGLRQRMASGVAEAGLAKRRGGGREGTPPGREGIDLLEAAARIHPESLRHHEALVDALLEVRAFDEAGAAVARAREVLDDAGSRRALDTLAHRCEALARGTRPPDASHEALHLSFVGRSEEFSTLVRRWREVRRGVPGVSLVQGEAGIGKTRLAEELLLVAESEGGRGILVKAEDSERPIEWGLLAEVIQRLLRLSGAAGISPASDAILRSLMPSLALGEQRADDPALRGLALSIPRASPSAALSDALLDLVTAVSDDAPLLLVVDDLQWADTESRTVLARVATRLDRSSALLLFTCRSEAPDPRLRKTLALVQEAPSAVVVELEPWSLAATTEALRSRLDFTHPARADAIIRRIHATSRGNPLFIVELLKVFLEEGIVEIETGDRWVFHTDRLPPDLPLPGSVRALVDRQLDQLSREATLVAAHMARIGHVTSPRVLGLQTGLGTSAVTNGIGELLARRMIRWEGSDSVTFVHDELRAAVARRYQLHVGLTAGGGAQWSFFRTAVAASLVTLTLGAALYAFANPDPFGPGPWGGGTIEATDAAGDAHLLRFRSGTPPSLEPAEPAPPAPGSRVRVVSDPEGHHHLHLVRTLEGGEVEVHPLGLAAPDPGAAPEAAFLSPDARYLGVVVPGPPDTVRLLVERGRIAHEIVLAEVLDLDWCGAHGLFILNHGPRGVGLVRWNPADGGPTPLTMERVAAGAALACSPDGRGLLLAGVRDGRPGVFLRELASGAVLPVTWSGAGAPIELAWTGSGSRGMNPGALPRAVPLAIQLEPEGPLSMGLGGQRLMEGSLVLSGGGRRREPLAWGSDDTTVVAVRPGGRVVAMGPGRTWVHARWGGWLEARVEVEVTGQVEERPFRALLPEESVPSRAGGQPRPLLEPFQVGAEVPITVEFELRARGEGARVELCTEVRGPEARACVGYPAQVGPRLEPDRISLATGAGIPPVRATLTDSVSSEDPSNGGTSRTLAAPGTWIPAALVVDAEGWVRLYVDGVLRAQGTVRLDRGTEPTPWRITLGGEGAAGAAGVRELRLWEGERRHPAGAGGS